MFDEQPDGDPHGECALAIKTLQARIAELEAERDALKVDAERYRYWRSASMDERNRLEHYAESALDIVIDASMKDQPKESGQ